MTTPLARGSSARIFAVDATRVLRLDDCKCGRGPDVAMSAAAAAGQAGIRVPAHLARVQVDEHHGTILERFHSDSLLDLMAHQPWLVLRAGAILGALHARIHQTSPPDSMSSLVDTLRERLENQRVPEGLPTEACHAVLQNAGRQDWLLHGDFNPSNLIRDARGSGWVAIDWSGATRGEPVADLAHTLNMIWRGKSPFGSSKCVQALNRLGRHALSLTYLRSYQEIAAVDRGRLELWRQAWMEIELIEKEVEAGTQASAPACRTVGTLSVACLPVLRP